MHETFEVAWNVSIICEATKIWREILWFACRTILFEEFCEVIRHLGPWPICKSLGAICQYLLRISYTYSKSSGWGTDTICRMMVGYKDIFHIQIGVQNFSLIVWNNSSKSAIPASDFTKKSDVSRTVALCTLHFFVTMRRQYHYLLIVCSLWNLK